MPRRDYAGVPSLAGPAVAALACFILVLFALNPYAVPLLQLGVSLGVAFLCSLPLLCTVSEGRLSTIPFFAFHLFFIAVAYGYSGIADYGLKKFGFSSEQVAQAWMLTLLYAACASSAYYLPSTRKGRRQTGADPPFTINGRSIGLVVAYAVLIASSALRYLPAIVDQLRIVFENILFARVAFALVDKRTRAPVRLVLAILVGIKCIVLMLGGFLAGVISLGAALFCAWVWVRQRSSAFDRVAIPLVFVVLGVYFVVTMNPVKNTYRKIANSSNSRLSAAQDALAYHYGEAFTLEYLKEGLRGVCDRFCAIPVLAGAIAVTPNTIPYKLGSTLAAFPAKLIPRVLWPDKPTETLGNEWGREYGFLSSDDYETSLNLPLIVEGYINGGWIGVAIIALVVGPIFRSIAQWFDGKLDDPWSRSAYLAIVYPLLFAESNFSNMLGGMLIAIFVLWVGARLLPAARQYYRP